MTTGEFMEEMRRILSRYRQLDGSQQLLRRKCGLINTRKEFIRQDPPLAA
jgi:hypothetical protein